MLKLTKIKMSSQHSALKSKIGHLGGVAEDGHPKKYTGNLGRVIESFVCHPKHPRPNVRYFEKTFGSRHSTRIVMLQLGISSAMNLIFPPETAPLKHIKNCFPGCYISINKNSHIVASA